MLPATADRRPKPVVQLAISSVIVLHLAAIIAAVTGAGSGQFSPPPIMAELRYWISPYLQSLFLGSPYRFFAPNPGVDPSLWVRIHFENDETRCLEWPHFRDRNLPSAYTRDFGIPRRLSSLAPAKANEPVTLTPTAEILLSSAARRITGAVVPETFAAELKRKELGAVRYIDVYSLNRKLVSPTEVRQGMDHLDLRLYHALYLGRFKPTGERLNDPAVQTIELDSLVATIIDQDIRPVAQTVPPMKDSQSLYRQRWPSQIEALLQAKPNLLALEAESLRAELKALFPPTIPVTDSTLNLPSP